ncbi:hypothetical protein B7494_g7847 [Chlorociboria aeruginascens]|nr:hypothetical protein B7494_g7847 [Chlorociboria aeruginascens]
MLSILLLTLVSLTISLPTDLTHRQTKPYQIRGVSDPIYHLYLQSLPGNRQSPPLIIPHSILTTPESTPVLGPESTSEYYTISDTIQSTNTSLYLNIGNSTTSYLPLTLDTTASTTAWGLEGDTIITTTGSSYGRQLNFLVCASEAAGESGYYDLFLQQGSDVPRKGISQRLPRFALAKLSTGPRGIHKILNSYKAKASGVRGTCENKFDVQL